MTARFDIAALGELLIDFTDRGLSDAGMRLFEQNPGGAPANMLAAAARLGERTAFIGKVGDDMHGRFLRDTLTAAGIDVTGLVLSPDVFTTLAFVALDDRGERHFSFARKPGADTCLRSDELPAPLLSSARVLHVSSLSLTDEPARSATFAAVEAAKRAGAVISYDPNYRAALWPDEAAAAAQMRSMVSYADVMKLSDEETLLLTGAAEPEEAAHRLLAQGVSCVAVTLGERGALVAVAGGMQIAPAFSSDPVDTTGAGDGFWGGFLKLFDTSKPFYSILYFLLIIGFSYFYATMQFNPIEVANNLKKNGGFIPGFRPGKPTADFIKKVLNKVTLFGAIYLGVVAILPLLIGKIVNVSSLSIGGTSVIIVVGVALETVQALESQMLMRQYKGFLE